MQAPMKLMVSTEFYQRYIVHFRSNKRDLLRLNKNKQRKK